MDMYLRRRQIGNESGVHESLFTWIFKRQRLVPNPAEHNDHHELELSGAWEPLDSSSSRRPGELKRTHSFVSYGN